jgi:adenosine kinase
MSIPVDKLDIRRGGIGATVAYGMSMLGHHPLLVGSAGQDFLDEHRTYLESHGVDTSNVRISSKYPTAHFMGITDASGSNLGTFYTGAMSEAKNISLSAIADKVGGIDFVVISPNDPQAMLNHTNDCRRLGIPFLADPSQQLAALNGDQILELVDDAAYLALNDYEVDLLFRKCGLEADDLLARVGTLIRTMGAQGVQVKRRGKPDLTVGPILTDKILDATGAGDSFRAGFMGGLCWQLPLERAAQLGALLATCCIETIGTQEYWVTKADALARLRGAYGDQAAREVEEAVAFRGREVLQA